MSAVITVSNDGDDDDGDGDKSISCTFLICSPAVKLINKKSVTYLLTIYPVSFRFPFIM